jgi:hypothetical protein
MNVAIINGVIASIDRAIDLAMVHRKIDKRYQSIYGNAFTENLLPTNESGFYFGISIRPFHGWKIDAYADFYKFPWLKYSIDSPSYGREFFMMIGFNPTKQLELSIRYKNEVKHSNFNSPSPLTEILLIPRSSLRTQFSYRFSRSILFKNRVELLWYGNKTDDSESGYLAYTDLHYKPFSLPFAGSLRLQYFETEGFNSRLYALENDVLYNYSTPVFFDKGFRWYLNIRTDVSQWILPNTSKVEIDLSLKYAMTHYFELDKIGSGNDEIQGKLKSELGFQVLVSR